MAARRTQLCQVPYFTTRVENSNRRLYSERGKDQDEMVSITWSWISCCKFHLFNNSLRHGGFNLEPRWPDLWTNEKADLSIVNINILSRLEENVV